jgi:polar amino acid transport system substrate-binding protein
MTLTSASPGSAAPDQFTGRPARMPSTGTARRPARILGVALLALAAAGCAPADEQDTAATSPTASGSTASSACTDAVRNGLVAPGKITIATGKPAYGPWFSDDDPTNGKGFESAVAYAVAEQIGFDKAAVTWISADFNAAIAPGAKKYDVNLQQVSITDERKQAVDFSSGYYDVAQAFVTIKQSKGAAAKSIADLAKLKLGAATGTTSYQAITDVIKPEKKPAIYDDNDKAKLALANGQIDALAADLPTALYLAAAELKGGRVIGQLANSGGTPEQFGFVLEKGSAFTPCVSEAVDTLRDDGTLAKLQEQWLTAKAGAPVLT